MDRPTPVLVADVTALDANIAAMQALADAHGVALRPHAKGHRAPWIAERQLHAGAGGIAVATVAEARTMLEAGVRDVLLTTSVAPQRAPELAALARGEALTVVADTPDAVSALAGAARAAGVVLPVLVEVDVGQRRGGARTPADAAAVAEAIVRAPGGPLLLRGVQGYDGHLQGIADPAARAAGHAEAMALLDAAVAAVRDVTGAEGLVTTAGTATIALAAAHDTVTEIQPGSYALMDASYAQIAGVDFAQAAYVLTTVTAVVGEGEVIVDAGHRAVSVDMGPAVVAGRPGAVWASAGDEHGRLSGDVGDLRPGHVVRLVPSHTDSTVVLHGAPVPLGPD